MSGQSSPSQIACGKCGFLDSGNFCSNCGAELKPAAETLLGSVGRDVLDIDRGHGFVAVLWRLVRSPVRTTLALANDPAYQGHWTFFVVTVAVSLFVQRFFPLGSTAEPAGIVSPDQGRWLQEFGEIAGSPDMRTAFTYVFFFTALLVGYFIFGKLAPAPRSPRAYLKLSCLSSGFSQLAFAAFVVPVVLARDLAGYAWVLAIPYFALAAYMAIYQFRVQKNFWGLTAGRTLLGAFFVAAATLPAGTILVVALMSAMATIATIANAAGG